MILTKVISNFNMLNMENLVFTLNTDGYCTIEGVKSRKYLEYKVIINGKERSVKCPVFKVQEGDSTEKMIRYLPSLLIPRKKFLTHVYLYAIQYYLTNNISMRKTADHVRAKFNLKSFSHSTISRILNKLSSSYEKLTSTFSESLASNASSSFVVRKKWDEAKQLKLYFISSILSDALCSPEIVADKICKEYFNENNGEFLF